MSVTELISVIAAVGTFITVLFAALVYYRNSKLERAKWSLSLYEKFYEQPNLKRIRDILDNETDDEKVTSMVIDCPSDFTDYLNFFEFVGFLESQRQLTRAEVIALFDYYLRCLNRHPRVLSFRIRRFGSPSGTIEMSEYIFVYGTLLPDIAPKEIRDAVKGLTFVGDGYVRGKLFDLGNYPGAKVNARSRLKIRGRVYRLPANEAVISKLDAYEEFNSANPKNSLYLRKKTKANLDNGKSVSCWIYVFNGDTKFSSLISSGEFVEVS